MAARERPLGWITPAVLGTAGLALAAMVASDLGLPAGACYDVAWTLAALSAVIGTLAARRRAHPDNRLRWTLWAAAAGSWLFGQIVWNVYGIVGFPASPNLADVGFWGFALLVMASMLRPPRGALSVRAVAASESMPLIIAVVCLCVAELWSDAARSHLGLAGRVSDMLYPALYASATIVTFQAMLGGSLRGMRTAPIRLVLAGIAAQALGFSLWSRELLNATYVAGDTVLDPLWVIGLLAIAAGGLLAARRPEEISQVDEPSHRGVVLPGMTFLLLFAALIVGRLTHATQHSGDVLRIGLLCSGAALIARSTLLGRRLQQLLDREREARRIVAEREADLARLNEQLVEDSRRDPLTGICNRRALADDMPMYEALQGESGRIALALCDVDHFKSYNDRLGHLAGDQALRMIAAHVRGALRAADTAYRFGGEELLLVMRDVGPDEAARIAERVRRAIAQAEFAHPDGEGGTLTVSVGVASGQGRLESLLARADGALYDAKRRGRNCVVSADPIVDVGAGFAGAAETVPAAHGRERPEVADEPVPRHLRSMLSVSRAAAAGRGLIPVVDALAEAIVSELSFQTVVVNLLEPESEHLRVVVVHGDHEARETLLHTTHPLAEWQSLLALGEQIHGAAWLAAGSYDTHPEQTVFTPHTMAAPGADAWHREDMLLLPLRGAAGELLGVVSVDQPQLGRRPSHPEIGVLMAVADHAGLALDQVHREGQFAHDGSAELRLAAVMLLAETLDLRDPSTALHSRTVGRFARATARQLGLSEARVDRIHAAGVLHDLGKLGIADAILQKPGKLDDAEWREMRRHSEVGARILEHAGMRDIAGWVRSHHERLDGRGYPDGLSGPSISLEARILAVCDSYEAMIADRPYRAGMPAAEARAELVRCSGTQFDGDVVAAFLATVPTELGAELLAEAA